MSFATSSTFVEFMLKRSSYVAGRSRVAYDELYQGTDPLRICKECGKVFGAMGVHDRGCSWRKRIDGYFCSNNNDNYIIVVGPHVKEEFRKTRDLARSYWLSLPKCR